MKKTDKITNEEHLGVRVPSRLLELVDQLIPHLSKDPEVQSGNVRMNRSTVLRRAIIRGLESMRQEYVEQERADKELSDKEHGK